MNDISELKPCPFCGSENVSESTGDMGGKPWKYIECIDCSAMAELKMWNQRAGLRTGSVTSDAVISASASDPKASSVLSELRKLEAQATPGPWNIGHRENRVAKGKQTAIADCIFTSSKAKYAWNVSAEECIRNASLIASLRNTALPLLTRQEEALRVASKAIVRVPICKLGDPGEKNFMTCKGCGAIGSESCNPDCWCLELETALASISAILDTTQDGK